MGRGMSNVVGQINGAGGEMEVLHKRERRTKGADAGGLDDDWRGTDGLCVNSTRHSGVVCGTNGEERPNKEG